MTDNQVEGRVPVAQQPDTPPPPPPPPPPRARGDEAPVRRTARVACSVPRGMRAPADGAELRTVLDEDANVERFAMRRPQSLEPISAARAHDREQARRIVSSFLAGRLHRAREDLVGEEAIERLRTAGRPRSRPTKHSRVRSPQASHERGRPGPTLSVPFDRRAHPLPLRCPWPALPGSPRGRRRT